MLWTRDKNTFENGERLVQIAPLALYCPFCHAEEENRLEAVDGQGNKILLVMFNCPFFHHFKVSEKSSDDLMQKLLNLCCASEGQNWLDKIGPVMKAREIKNMKRHRIALHESG